MKEIKTSYWALLSTAIWSWIVLFIPTIIQALNIYFTKYTYNDDNLIIKRGIIKQEQLSIQFYRLMDIQANQSIIGQLLKYGVITLADKDKIIKLQYVHNPEVIANELRDIMVKVKKENGLKVMDFQ